MSPGTLWYRRTIQLPGGEWTTATLRLNGARFAPVVYVDGEKLSESDGGMAPIEIPLRCAEVIPGKTIGLEISLKSLRDLNPLDASAVPVADYWRSDLSSGLWDDVGLHFSKDGRITSIIPWTDFSKDSVSVHWEIDDLEMNATPRTMEGFILDQSGDILARSGPTSIDGNAGVTELNLNHACQPWSPDAPNLYKLKLVLSANGHTEDSREISWGLRDFRVKGLRFTLNGQYVQLRGGSVVWHRWLRDPQARTLAFDPNWFEKNIVLRLKTYGANYLRFHLGLPPESFLDLCDRDGLMVQMEWPFFHGVAASAASMRKQWREWLDAGARHPCVVLLQPWNETEDDELTNAWSALNSILPEYPPCVIDHRDVIPIHKYWWSLFENLGLYYDSATQFDRPIVVDEFGGNYLDGNGDIGADPVLKESFPRFLGREQTREERLEFQAEACAKIAEYWRRLGAAGYAPFCILSSPEDGNTWFLGNLKDGNPKPVWAAMSAAYAPLSVSLEVWDRNYTPGKAVTLPLYFFNDTDKSEKLNVRLGSHCVKRNQFERLFQLNRQLKQFPHTARGQLACMSSCHPRKESGALKHELDNPAEGSTMPVVSTWDCRTLEVKLPTTTLIGVTVGVSADDTELRRFFDQNGIQTVGLENPKARMLVLSASTWAKLPQSPMLLRTLQNAVDQGQSVVLLDIGPRDLGQGYKEGELGPHGRRSARPLIPALNILTYFLESSLLFKKPPNRKAICIPLRMTIPCGLRCRVNPPGFGTACAVDWWYQLPIWK